MQADAAAMEVEAPGPKPVWARSLRTHHPCTVRHPHLGRLSAAISDCLAHLLQRPAGPLLPWTQHLGVAHNIACFGRGECKRPGLGRLGIWDSASGALGEVQRV